MEISSVIPPGRRMIDGYPPGGFRVAGALYQGPMLIWPEGEAPWSLDRIEDLALAHLDPVRRIDPPVEVLLIGCGPRMVLLPSALRRQIREAGIGMDAMDTGAACRTYNVLISEGRRAAAALIPV
ncbi:Mth938-like domain-containing protein [Inquilinus sp. Marseille-Q2685]|uniref:Mth938-like domain-containing protein n=1 Tax=Inquilinus sp. Marseille-Q2685 TaxID=2866581 RepID=UPI001CE4559C|nr:Mth938-like domain-containing protein [Inquilinus sp. Marseille-Q2685]